MSPHKKQAQPANSELAAQPREPGVYELALGRSAVAQANLLAHHTAVEDQKSSAQSLHESLSEVRGTLAELDTAQGVVLDMHLDSTASPSMRHLKQTQAPETSWAHWLATPKKDLEDETIGTTDEQLTKFLQWHIGTLESHQLDPETQQNIRDFKLAFERAAVGAASGEDHWISQRVLSNRPKFQQLNVYAGDIFDTTLQDLEGYHIIGSNDIVYATGFSPRKTEDILYHEATHALLEVTTPPQEHGKKRELFSDHWFSEAMTQHIAQALRYGKADVVHPHIRQEEQADQDPTDLWRRQLLHTFLAGENKPVDPRLATRAFTGTHDERQKFLEAVYDAWDDRDIITKLQVSLDMLTLTATGNKALQKQVEAATGVPSEALLPASIAVWQVEKMLREKGRAGLDSYLMRLGFDPGDMKGLFTS